MHEVSVTHDTTGGGGEIAGSRENILDLTALQHPPGVGGIVSVLLFAVFGR